MNVHPQAKVNRRGCELCGASSFRELYTARDRLSNSQQHFIIAFCEQCGVYRTLPEMSEGELSWYYRDDYWGNENEPSPGWIKKNQAEKTRFLARCGLIRGSILDVGCGSGFFLRALDGERWDRFGVETGQAAAASAGRALGPHRVFNGTLIESACADEAFDVVTFWSSLEHMNDPRANLLEARRIIKPAGTLIVQAPNIESYQARWFGGDWFALDAPRHRYHFSRATLERLLNETGFEIYRSTFFSKNHNAHALRQSLKTRLGADKSRPNRLLFTLSTPFIKPFDFIATLFGAGATLTVAARAIA
ncbi:MAG TPA: class I SAM-dependent methyltransferase [Blastocatellia bacterium]